MEALQKGYSLTVRENIGDAYKLLTTAMVTTKQMCQEKIKRYAANISTNLQLCTVTYLIAGGQN